MKLLEGTTWLLGLVGSGIVFLLGLIGYGIKQTIADLKQADQINSEEIKTHDRRIDDMEVELAGLKSGQKEINKNIHDSINEIKEILKDIQKKL